MTDDDVQVRANTEQSRYEIWVGDVLAGFTEYRRHGAEADFVHTEIDDQFGGRGLASRLIHEALDDARAQGWTVLPYCPFVRAYIGKHPEYVDLVPEPKRARFGL